MNRYPLLFIVMLSVFPGPGHGVGFNELVFREGLYLDKSTDLPFTGNVKGLFEGFITAGKKEGPWIEFYRKKRLYLKGSYKNGKRDGSWAAYWSNGQLVHQATFKNGARQGNWNDYITDGNVAKMFATISPGRRGGNCLIVK